MTSIYSHSISAFIAFTALFTAGCSNYPMHGRGRHGMHGCGFFGSSYYGTIILYILLGAVIGGAVVYAFYIISKKRSAGEESPGPLASLKERYARGEISEEEYDRIKKKITE